MRVLISALTLISLVTPAYAQTANIVCQNDIPQQETAQEANDSINLLWTQTLLYLEGFREALEHPRHCLDSGQAAIETGANAQQECIARYRDVELAMSHLDKILENPVEAKTCFDPQKNYDSFPLYTPSTQMKQESIPARWLDRPLLTDFYQNKSGEIKTAGLELSKNFKSVLEASSMPEHLSSDVTFSALPDLWTSVGWIPFYADNERALNPRFRGGYAYAEVMGPWGMLRIDSIDGEKVGLELGMTIQLEDTFYPYHYHHPQEIYITLSDSSYGEQNQFMVMHWDNGEFMQNRREKGWTVDVHNSGRAMDQWFRQQDPNGNWLAYFERNAIHSFYVGKAEGDSIGGLTTVWARTTARDNNQSTRICDLITKSADKSRPATPDAKYRCELDDWSR